MRLTDEQVLTIKNIALTNFGAHAKLKLFGSRLDDSKRGGDIDLLVEADFSPDGRQHLTLLETPLRKSLL